MPTIFNRKTRLTLPQLGSPLSLLTVVGQAAWQVSFSFRDLFLQDSRVFHRHNTSGARSRDQALPGLTITSMLVGLTFGN